jgi:hypothetical protein
MPCPSDLGFPSARALTGLFANVAGGNVTLTFDPQDDAVDYRVYVLPQSGQVSGDTNTNATYRCAGDYEIPPVSNEDNPRMPPGAALTTRINSQVMGFARTTSDAQLGYVMLEPGPSLVPVYALGDPATDADTATNCYFQRYPESRVKRYTTSAADRAMLVAQHWRDDGIAFYAPADGTSGTVVVYRQDPVYMTPGAELTARMAMGTAPAPAFSVFTSSSAGAVPLMRVFYDSVCGRGHDELVATMAGFNKAYKQGTEPFGELHYSGITGPTTLVVEAVDRLCPFQGLVSARARPAGTAPGYPALLTPDQMRAASSTGEVYINGQGAPGTPHAVARACVQVSPTPLPSFDWSYDGHPETYTTEVPTVFQTWTFGSPTFDFELDFVVTDEWSVGSLFGELWVTYGDNAGDTTARLTMTPKTKPTLGATDFVHATMEVDMLVTDRRFPQLVITDNGSPPSLFEVHVQGGLTGPVDMRAEFCNQVSWGPGGQCPMWDMHTIGGSTPFLAPHLEFNGRMGTDRTRKVDAYVSTSRVYVFLDGAPYGCGDIPAGQLLAGPATVMFADVLFSSSKDFNVPWFPFHTAQMKLLDTRHFSNLGFSSHVQAPAWDESVLPCVAATALALPP